jgi:hypothetical protein
MAQAANTQELISKETRVAVQSAFHSLEQAVLIHNAWTLEDLVPLKRMVREVTATERQRSITIGFFRNQAA